MTIINQKSISGITSITTAAAGDNLLTVHTNNGTERLRIDSSGNTRITAGIVTTLTVTGNGTVGGTLSVTGDVDIADKIVHTGDTNTAIRFPAADTVTVETGGSERLRVDSSGKLTLAANSTAYDAFQIGDGLYIGNTTNNASAAIFHQGGGADLEIGSQDAITFTTGSTAGNATEKLRITSTGLVGIGTDNPTDTGGYGQALDITGGSGGAAIYLRSANGDTGQIALGSGDLTIRTRQADPIIFNTNNSEKARITSAGLLDVSGGVQITENVTPTSGAGLELFREGGGGGQVQAFDRGGSAWLPLILKGSTQIFHTSGSERLRITSDGKFGFKTTTPNYTVDINGEVGITEGQPITWHDGSGSLSAQIFAQSDDSLVFRNTSVGAERMRIDSSGTMMIGNTVDNPGDANTNAGIAFRQNGKYFLSCAADGGHVNRNSDGYILHARRSGNHVGGITVNSSNTSFNTSSDYRLKENVVDLSGAITRVKQLAPKRFNFIIDADKTVDGFLAHEAQTVVPEAVTGTHNEVDGDGNAVMQGIDQSKLVPLLTAALKESIAEIESLKTRVAALEGS